MRLHDVQQLMNDLAHVLSEALAGFEGVNGLQYFNVELDFLLGNSIGTDTEKHGYDNVEVVVED